MLQPESGFQSFFQGGFECSSHRRPDNCRLDLIAATGHDTHALTDYSMLASRGLMTCRDGLRWHLIEPSCGNYEFASFLPMVRAARRAGVQVIWDLCHYGWPDDLDIFRPEFITRFARFCRATASVVTQETDEPPYFAPVNEPSFFSWAGAEVALFNPCLRGRGAELKMQLIRAAIAATEAIRDVCPNARFVQSDPLIHIVPRYGASDAEVAEATAYRNAQFQGWDMLTGALCPELGGHPKYLDIVGCNYYIHNQWEYGGKFITRSDLRYRPLWKLLREVYERYHRPVFIAETGIEGEDRPEWLHYITGEVVEAICMGAQVEGICLYPIVSYPGWDDERRCETGLWGYCNNSGHREVYIPLDEELKRQQRRVRAVAARLSRDKVTIAGVPA